MSTENPERAQFKRLCRQLDTTTLLALIPELRHRTATGRQELQRLTDMADEAPEHEAAAFESLHDPAAAWDARREDAPRPPPSCTRPLTNCGV